MDKDRLDNELASAVMSILMKHIVTGTHENGKGLYLDCKIDFRYLHNAGGVFVEELKFNSEVSEFNKY